MNGDTPQSRQRAHAGGGEVWGQGWIFQEAWSGYSGLSNLELNGREGPAGTWLPQLFPPLPVSLQNLC